jgi:hypothetical protein
MLVGLQAFLTAVSRDQLDLGIGQSALGQPRQHLVPEQMRMDALDASLLSVLSDDLLDPARRVGAEPAALEQVTVLRMRLEVAGQD